MDKTAGEAKKIIEENGCEVLNEMVDCFEYTNGCHVFMVSFDDEGVWDVTKVASIDEYYEEE